MKATCFVSVPPPQPPSKVSLGLECSLEEAKILRSILGNISREAVQRAMNETLQWLPKDHGTSAVQSLGFSMVRDLSHTIGDQLRTVSGS